MRIATWNVNGLRARLDFVVHWLRARQPDIVGIQELKLSDDQFPHRVFESEGYHALVHGQKAWNGVAVLSRQPGELIQTGLPGQEAAGARLLTGLIEGVEFTTVYCPNGKHVEHEDFPRKLEWFDALIEHLSARSVATRAAVICGDFNLCPGALDTYDEEHLQGSIFHTPQERERFQRMLQLGLHDLYRWLYPETRAYSWWDYRGGAFHRNLGLRIDLVLATRSLRDRVHDVWIDREYRKKKEGMTASDHAPVIADLDEPVDRWS